VTTCDMTTTPAQPALRSQPEPASTGEQAELSASAVRGGASLGAEPAFPSRLVRRRPGRYRLGPVPGLAMSLRGWRGAVALTPAGRGGSRHGVSPLPDGLARARLALAGLAGVRLRAVSPVRGRGADHVVGEVLDRAGQYRLRRAGRSVASETPAREGQRAMADRAAVSPASSPGSAGPARSASISATTQACSGASCGRDCPFRSASSSASPSSRPGRLGKGNPVISPMKRSDRSRRYHTPVRSTIASRRSARCAARL
jgi:hypothetical protein